MRAPFLWGPADGETVPGATAARVFVDWAAVEPAPGEWDEESLAALRARLGALADVGVEPLLTLHRGADPAWFVSAGGWLRGDAVQLFCRFVVKVVEEVGDLVSLYVTVEGPTHLAARSAGTEVLPSPAPGHTQRRALRAFLHAHGAARRTLHGATPRHGPRPTGVRPQGRPLAGLAHHLCSVRPPRGAGAADRVAAATADYLWNWLPLRVTMDGRLHAPLGHGQALLELQESLDFVGLIPAPPVVLSVAGSTVRRETAGPVSPAELTHLLRRAGRTGRPVLVVADGPCAGGVGGEEALLAGRVATLRAAGEAGVDVWGYLSVPQILSPAGLAALTTLTRSATEPHGPHPPGGPLAR